MQTLIINLETSLERRNFQIKQFALLDMSCEFLKAVSVADISEEQYQAQAFSWQRPLRKVELACFYSHQLAWQQVIERNQPCLILEDDAVLSKQTKKVLQKIEKEQWPDIDYINFEVRSRKKILSKSAVYTILEQTYQFFELYQDRTGAAGYLLYPSGARKLLDRLQKAAPALADGFICASYQLNSLQIEPALIIQDDQLQAYGLHTDVHVFESTIGRSEHHKAQYRNISEKINFKSRRIWAQLQMAMRYIRVLPRATKRFVKLDKTNISVEP